MAIYAIQSPGHGGLNMLTSGMTTPVNGDQVQPGPGTFLLIQSGASGAATLSIPLPTYDGQVVGPRVFASFGASNIELIPIPTSVYGSSLVTLTWGGTLTTVVVAAVTVTTT